MTNGHADGVDSSLPRPSPQPTRDESELPDADDIPTHTISSHAAPQDEAHSDDDAIHDMATSSLDEDEDAPGEDDADFDETTPPPGQTDAMDHDRSSSESSSRPGKRKVDVDDEEYMKQNPELYGLRRSVCAEFSPWPNCLLTYCNQGRARPTRRVVCSRPLKHDNHSILIFSPGR